MEDNTTSKSVFSFQSYPCKPSLQWLCYQQFLSFFLLFFPLSLSSPSVFSSLSLLSQYQLDYIHHTIFLSVQYLHPMAFQSFHIRILPNVSLYGGTIISLTNLFFSDFVYYASISLDKLKLLDLLDGHFTVLDPQQCISADFFELSPTLLSYL